MTGSVTSSRPKISLTRRRAIARSLTRSASSGEVPEGRSLRAGFARPDAKGGLAPCYGRDDRDLVLRVELRVKSAREAHVLVVQVHVHELPEVARRVEQAVLEAGVARVELLDRLPQVIRLQLDCRVPLREGAQRSRDAN